MIFVTVGSQLPFDRLIKSVDQWAANNTDHNVIAQIGISEYTPENIEFYETMLPDDYNRNFEQADLIVAHAGMGTIISSLELKKPLVLLARLAGNGEHRNDHQLATSKHFSDFKNITVVVNESELFTAMNTLINQETLFVEEALKPVSAELITAIQQFIFE